MLHSFLPSATRFAAMALPVIVLAGCSQDPPEIRACEAYVKAFIDAPATYKRASASSFESVKDGQPIQSVTLNYDAANTFGVPVREMEFCKFALVRGKPVTRGYERGVGLDMLRTLRRIEKRGGGAPRGCCL